MALAPVLSFYSGIPMPSGRDDSLNPLFILSSNRCVSFERKLLIRQAAPEHVSLFSMQAAGGKLKGLL